LTNHYDIAIIGAGPAGATAALALKDSRLSVVVIDKSTFPRDKICGDAIGGRVKKVLKEFPNGLYNGFENFQPKNLSRGWKLFSPNGKTIEVNFVNSGYISKRLDFDDWLYSNLKNQKHIKLIEGADVTDIIKSGDCFTIVRNDSPINASLIIGCDGAQSIVAKRLANFKVDHRHYSGAVRAYYSNVEGTANSEMLEIHLIKNYLPGYFWIFPLKNNLSNVGFGMLSKDIKERRIDLKAALKEIIRTTPHLQQRFANAELIDDVKGFGLPLGGKRRPLSGHRFMLCGDAASLIDPLTGEGIGNAMLSGLMAAKQAIRCFEKNDFSAAAMADYDKRVYRKLMPELRKNLILQQLMNRPWLIDFLVKTAEKNPRIKNWIAKQL